MAAEKRKSAAAVSSKPMVKRRKLSNDGAVAKPPTTKPSLLAKEQPAFPRGGAGPLSTLERKQIRAQAARDVAREETDQDLFAPQQSQPRSANDSDEEFPAAEAQPTQQTDLKKSKRSKKKSKPQNAQNVTDSVRIESLAHKRLADGQMLLGCVNNITSRELAISLPNNLVGYVPLTSVSDTFSQKLQQILAKDSSADSDAEGDDADEDDHLDLRRHFKIGQYLRVAITSTSDDTQNGTDHKRKLSLSIDPRHTNTGLSKVNVSEGSFLQAAVVSVEDHGLIVDIGLDDKIRGFISQSQLGNDIDIAEVLPGSVLLCHVLSAKPKGKILQLSSDLPSAPVLQSAASVENFLPGVRADILLTDVSADGLAGKVMGMLDVTADMVHSGLYKDRDTFLSQYKIGQRVVGRLIAQLPLSDNKKFAFSILDNTIDLKYSSTPHPLQSSDTVSDARVICVAPRIGAYLDLGHGATGFAHISRLSDKTVELLSESSGAFKLGSQHKARILDYNTLDGLYVISLQKSVLEQPFLRYADVKVGEVIKVEIEKVLIGENGITSLIARLSPNISGIIPPVHFADATLRHPEKKFKEGMTVNARILSVDPDRKRISLTLKKSLINSDQPIWSAFGDISTGSSSVGTLIKLDSRGALMQFFGSVKGYLPVSEMSEAHIKDATEHFTLGQVLSVTAIDVDAENGRMRLSARDQSLAASTDMSKIKPASLCDGVVFEKSKDDLLVRLHSSGITARLTLDHSADGSAKACRKAFETIRVDQTLKQLIVLEVQKRGRLVTISNKPSLRKAVENGMLLNDFENLKEGACFTGFVSNITESGVFVRFAAGISGFVAKAQLPEQQQQAPQFDLRNSQAVTARVQSIDYSGATPRFWLTLKEKSTNALGDSTVKAENTNGHIGRSLEEAIDTSLQNTDDLTVGAKIAVQVISVKETQLNVEIAKGVQGRIDVSEAFDSIDDIVDRKHPLKQFSPKQILETRILGAHDTRTHRFLPLSHRSSKNIVYELSARPSVVRADNVEHIELSDLNVDQALTVFVNNIRDNTLMVNVTPAIRGRIRASEVSDDLGLATNLARNFPIGSAMKAKVVAIDADKNWLDLSARTSGKSKLSLENINVGDVLPGRITKITERALVLQLSEDITGVVELTDMSDDFDQADPTRYQRNEIMRAAVVEVDRPNKKIFLSARPSRILSSDLEAKDPEVNSAEDLNVGDVRRGFVSSVAEKGVFVRLGRTITAFVRVTNLSDDYVKDWKELYQRDQLVTGKVIVVDKASGRVQMSLRKAHVAGDYRPPVAFGDLSVGDVVVAKVAKVETFGVFIVVINSENVRGLCHRSEIADKRVEDVRKLGFNEGDPVKAKVLKLDPENRRVNFGMKASYFIDDGGDSEVDSVAASMEDEAEDGDMSSDAGVEIPLDQDDDLSDANEMDVDVKPTNGFEVSEDADSDEDDDEPAPSKAAEPKGLSAGGFDWDGTATAKSSAQKRGLDDAALESNKRSKQQKKKANDQIDRTADLDVDGPQSADDFERLLLGEREPLQLWLRYMAFHIDLGEIDEARAVGKRALASIKLGQENDRTELWSALLNLENAFGDDQTMEDTFKEALSVCDPEEMYSRLASIYILSGKNDKADTLFQEMVKKFTQDPKLWVNYATFLFDKMEDPARARMLLPRALQALPPFTHFDISSRFARLEFTTKTGVPEEGRTRFQGLVSLYPKKIDVFNVMIDLEVKLGDYEQVRSLFEQVLARALKPKQASSILKKWLEIERKNGDARKVEEIEARAVQWVAKYKKENS